MTSDDITLSFKNFEFIILFFIHLHFILHPSIIYLKEPRPACGEPTVPLAVRAMTSSALLTQHPNSDIIWQPGETQRWDRTDMRRRVSCEQNAETGRIVSLNNAELHVTSPLLLSTTVSAGMSGSAQGHNLELNQSITSVS